MTDLATFFSKPKVHETMINNLRKSGKLSLTKDAIDNQDIESNKPAEWIQNYVQLENNYYILGLIVKLEQNP